MKISRFFIIIFFPAFCSAQNLLINGDFEEENICFEYKVNCAPEAWITDDDGYNNYLRDGNRAYTGTHCMSVVAGQAGKTPRRTFIRSRLLCGLRKGSLYRLEFFIKSAYPILDSIGINFTATDPLFEIKPIQAINPSLYLADAGKDFKKDSSWQRVSCDYKATGEETFLTLGNFAKMNIRGETGIYLESRFFVYFDHISLTPLNPKENLCEEWRANMEDIYDEDERHDFLRKKIKFGRNGKIKPVVLTPNTVSRVDTLVLQEILFETAKSDLHQESYSLLDSFCRQLTGKRVDSVVVEGHTDSRGSTEMNNVLSVARVQTILNFFASKSFVKPNRVYPRAWGETRPVADNRSPEGRQRNRRVVVFAYLKE
jgi:outer membrane protein OmpA-like peptidoglycan-associated protein